VAAGRTNRELADELVLSVRTVERHLTNIYTKLGTSGRVARAAAAAFATGSGLCKPLLPPAALPSRSPAEDT
jgi:DNA-binding NarL/FixJ family response regulator